MPALSPNLCIVCKSLTLTFLNAPTKSGARGRPLHRAAIATILQHQFGNDAMTLDPDYQHMIDLVCDAIESDPDLLNAMITLVDRA